MLFLCYAKDLFLIQFNFHLLSFAQAATVGTESRVMRRLEALSDCLLFALPSLYESVVIQAAPIALLTPLRFSPASKGSIDPLFLTAPQRAPLVAAFESLVQSEGEIAVPLYFVWLTQTLVPSLISLCGSLDLSHRPLVSLCAKFLNAVCEVLGRVATDLFIRNACEAEIKRLAGVEGLLTMCAAISCN